MTRHPTPPLAAIAALALILSACSQEDSGSQTPAPSSETRTETPAANDRAASETEVAYGEIDQERLMNADSEPGNWFTAGRDFGKGHFSPLTRINTDNVGDLGLAWEYDMFTSRGMEATPIVVDGVMYTSGVSGRVYALDAATGEEIWFFDPQSDGQYNRYTCCDAVNRGVAVWEGMVYVGSLDGRLFGLDAETGEVVWEQDTLIYEDRAYTSSGAPEVAGDVVVIGNGGAEYDARGYITAYDLKTGEQRWRFFTVPRDPEKGQEHEELEVAVETWDPESRWDVGGGGTVWDGMVYDPELNLLYVGTGNAALYNWKERSPSGGDNLFLASVLAINPDTGRLVWYHQQVPEERWDYTSVQPMILSEMTVEGETRKVLMHAPKNGFFYIYDRETGDVLSADEYVPVNWATHVDLETGRPAIDRDAADYSEEPKFVYPSNMGGHNWHPMAYSPQTGLVYIPAIESGMITGDLTEGHEYVPRVMNTGTATFFGPMLLGDLSALPEVFQDAVKVAEDSGQLRPRAVLKAFDPKTGDIVWEQEGASIMDRSGVLATAGGLVFKGTDTGYFQAFDAESGERLLNIHVGTSMMAAPMSYMVDGVQYIAIQLGFGGGGWASPAPNSAARTYGNENRILAFKLNGGDVKLPPELPPVQPIPEPPELTASAETIAKGDALFGYCRPCHANDPRGQTPDLRRMTEATHAAFKDIVLNGTRIDRMMPKWDDVLDEEDAEAIHAYLISQSWTAYEAQEENRELDEEPEASSTGH